MCSCVYVLSDVLICFQETPEPEPRFTREYSLIGYPTWMLIISQTAESLCVGVSLCQLIFFLCQFKVEGIYEFELVWIPTLEMVFHIVNVLTTTEDSDLLMDYDATKTRSINLVRFLFWSGSCPVVRFLSIYIFCI